MTWLSLVWVGNWQLIGLTFFESLYFWYSHIQLQSEKYKGFSAVAYLSLPESHWRLSTLQLIKHELSWLLGTEEKNWWFSTLCQRSLLIGEVEYGGILLFPSLGTFPKILVKEIHTKSLSVCPVASNFCIFNLAVISFKIIVVLNSYWNNFKYFMSLDFRIVRKTTSHKCLLAALWRIRLCFKHSF